jgi:sulfatase maturation enzyme AslB (radical SAM superfamily)
MSQVISYLDEIIFSIDSGIPFIHNAIRGDFSYTFDKATKNLEFIAKLRDEVHPNLYIAVDTTLQKSNWKTFDSILDIAKKYNTKINFDPVQLL